MKEALKIARKELLTYVREERFWLIVLMPLVVMPLLMYLPFLLLGRYFQQAEDKVHVVVVKGVSQELQHLLQGAKFVVQHSRDPRRAVQERLADVGLVYAEGRYTIFDRNNPLSVRPSVATERAREILQRYKEHALRERLQGNGLELADLEPFAIEIQKAVGDQQQALGLLALLIPFAVVVLVIEGGKAVALEATVGEKEKATLEALLSAPVAPWKLLLGKGLAVVVAALFAAFASMAGFALGNVLARHSFAAQIEALPIDIEMQIGAWALTPTDLATIFLTSMLFALFVTSAMLALGIFARSYREAGIYFSPLEMLMLAPLLFFVFSDFVQVRDWFLPCPAWGLWLQLTPS